MVLPGEEIEGPISSSGVIESSGAIATSPIDGRSVWVVEVGESWELVKYEYDRRRRWVLPTVLLYQVGGSQRLS